MAAVCVRYLLRDYDGGQLLRSFVLPFYALITGDLIKALGADITLAYQAHAVRGVDELPDPFPVYAYIPSVPSLIKGGGFFGIALLSDCVIVR